MIVRPETAADHAPIRAVTLAAFDGHPHSDQTEHLIIERLRAADALTVSLVCEDDGDIIGHIAFSPVVITQSEGDVPEGWFGLGPISVLPQRQGQGIGRRLMETGIEAMRQRGANGIVLLGDPDFYRKFGFENDPALVLPDIAPQYFLSLPLSVTRASGIVAYHPGFYPG